MIHKKKIFEEEIKVKRLTDTQVRDAKNKLLTLIRKKPDISKDGPLKAVEWIESIIKLYKSYE